MDLSEKRELSDEEASMIINHYCKVESGEELQIFDIDKRNTYIKMLRNNHNLSIRQIERLTGISRGIIQKI